MIKSFRYAINGVAEAVRTQWNFRVHFACTVIVIIAGACFKISTLEWIILILCMGLVLAFEMINTAVEYLVDHVSPDYHPNAGKVKDISAGAVLVAAVAAFITGCIIFLPRFIRLIGG